MRACHLARARMRLPHKQWKYSEKIEKHIYSSETLKIMEKIVEEENVQTNQY